MSILEGDWGYSYFSSSTVIYAYYEKIDLGSSVFSETAAVDFVIEEI